MHEVMHTWVGMCTSVHEWYVHMNGMCTCMQLAASKGHRLLNEVNTVAGGLACIQIWTSVLIIVYQVFLTIEPSH